MQLQYFPNDHYKQAQFKYHIIIVNMNKYSIILVILILTQAYSDASQPCKLSIVSSPDDASLRGTNIEIYPAVYSSPIDNMKNKLFTIFKAEPIDGCTRISEPKIDKSSNVENTPYIVVVDGQTGFCGFRRRIQMAKEVGAKGLIIMNENLQHAIDPYGQYSDNTFLVFIVKPQQSKKVLLPDTYVLATISTSASATNNTSNPQLQFWISTLDSKSYELITFWEQTLRQIPVMRQKVNWKPRYALWGCSSGLFTPGSACVQNPEYLSSCACAGQFCSPETKYKSSDAIVKEDIRQRIIFEYHKDKFMQYIVGFANNCLKQFQKQLYAQDCAISLMMNLGIDYYAIQQKIDNFMTKCSGNVYDLLLLDRNRFTQLGAYPSVILQRTPIHYSSKRDFQSKICKKLSLDQQEGCAKASRINTIINVTINILFFILIIAGLIVIVGTLIYLYRKNIRKDMQKQVKMQVSASVQHYFALTETK